MAFPIEQPPHFVLLPFMAQGHMIPMMDIARLLALHGVIITILTTPHNLKRFRPVITRAQEAGLPVRVIELSLPCVEAGLPEGCENFDLLPSLNSATMFFKATNMLQGQVEELLPELNPPPSCILADMCFPWTTNVAHKFHIPRLVFHGMCCFSLLSLYTLGMSRAFENVESESEYFVVPGLPDKIEMNGAQISNILKPSTPEWKEISDQMREAEMEAYGVVVNSFEELEKEYVKQYRETRGKKVWCIGPVSQCNKENLDKAERGNKSSIDENHCLRWLDSCEKNSVLYACLGSLARLATSQMIELGLGLEASNRPFIWVIRHLSDEFQKWLLEQKFEERVRGRGLIIYGWAPQVLILSHAAIGGFLTHCGWNSTLEGISAGVPLITWPAFAEQFFNERLVVNVLKTGLRAGVELPVLFGEEEKVGVQVNRNDLKVVIDRLMDEGEEAEERRHRAKKLGEMARRALEEGGSSHLNMTKLVQDMREQSKQRKSI